MTDEELIKARDLAIANLERVARLVDARLSPGLQSAVVQIGRYQYKVFHNGIRRWIPPNDAEWNETCLVVGNMPYQERIAATLLLLKNDPTIFNRWARRDGPHA